MSSKPTTNVVDKLLIRDFRNLKDVNVAFSPDINVLVGDNGHGKTNTLEAISIACSLKPMQSLHNNDLIHVNENKCHISAHFSGICPSEVKIDIFTGGKKAWLNEKSITSARKLAEQTPLVSFIPIELNMISGGSALRRRALDQATCALFIDHINALRAYEKLLLHRNRLLKSWPLDHATLQSFTELFIKEGAHVIHYRLKALEQLESHFTEQSSKILGRNEIATLSYQIGEQRLEKYSIGDLVEYLRELQKRNSAHEIARRVSLFGPHLDNLAFYINGLNSQKCASRGQTRALVIAFKLAQMLAIFQVRGMAPIIILDDIVSELDHHKKDNLMTLIANLGTQAFFSATDVQCFGGQLPYGSLFMVKEGHVAKI